MKRYRIHRNFGWVGTHDSFEDEFENEEDALEAAEEYAMERVEFWTEELEGEE